ncbi:MBL fold metallo-hydrolase [Herpetosiphon giganteus]|uniref:MBL fold metallo-hydrolase n=1 Tax=Herpetosiphon giganteus TaxID=2029754 RepID=UPI00195E8947|nr:MBL fold metallo-hydrolase [Herpetosiphon giganteus]MBM7844851.1 hydroxyacylglutathione hydrolase [Herpetosiphon giganteus]
MFFQRLYHDGLAQASYLVGCQKTGEGLVIDPHRDSTVYLNAAKAAGLRISAITETHIHADFVSGSRELAQITGAKLYLSAAGPAAWHYAFANNDPNVQLINDGTSWMVGNLKIEVLHTPGHTPEHVIFMLTDTPAGDQPMGIFTGDLLFVGDVGRPDLLEKAAGVQGTSQAAAQDLFTSLQRIKQLPDFLQVWPGHGSGSACGKALGAVPQSTLGYEKQVNWAFKQQNEADFVATVLDGQPTPPPYFAAMKRINHDGPEPRPQHLPALSLVDIKLANRLVIDLRSANDFAQASIPGALSLSSGAMLNRWAGWFIPVESKVVLIGTEAEAKTAQTELSMIGIDQIEGFITPDMLAEWLKTNPSQNYQRRPAASLVDQLDQAFVLDVRTPEEYANGHGAKAVNIPLNELPKRMAEIPNDQPLIVHCQAGGRSPIAMSLLKPHFSQPMLELSDGWNGWYELQQERHV